MTGGKRDLESGHRAPRRSGSCPCMAKIRTPRKSPGGNSRGGRLVSTCTRQPVPFARTPCVPAYILMDGEGRAEEQISKAANHELPGVAPRAGA